jgi:hypothetical protein
MTRADKKTPRAVTPEETAKAFAAFAAAGYPDKKFTDALYQALMHCFGFIAHFDRNRFYHARFVVMDDRIVTLRTIVAPTPWAIRPVEAAIRQVALDRGLLDAAILERDQRVEAAERAELARLKDKYEEVDPLS